MTDALDSCQMFTAEYGSDLIEWLRQGCCADCPPDCETCGNLRAAANRIEVLEAFQAGHADMVNTLLARIQELEAALRALLEGSHPHGDK